MVCDQVLEPGDYPWQTSESQVVAMEFKSHIKRVMEELQYQKNQQIQSFLPPHQQQPDEEQ